MSRSAADAVREAIRFRRAVKRFQERIIPGDVLRDILESTVRAPSSFNVQPYKVLLVSSGDRRDKLASCMVAGNATIVRQAPVAAVFAADLGTSRRGRAEWTRTDRPTPHLRASARRAAPHAPGTPGWRSRVLRLPTPAVSRLPDRRRLRRAGSEDSRCHSRGGGDQLARSHAELGRGRPPSGRLVFRSLSTRPPARNAGLGVQEHDASSPGTPALSTRPTSIRSCSLASQNFMIAAASHGIQTSPMEGFDAALIAREFGIPRRFGIPVVVCAGYPVESDWFATRRSGRFSLRDTVRVDDFLTPFEPEAGSEGGEESAA